MTGYGKGRASGGGLSLTCEVKTVNHRYLDVSVRLPRDLAFLEIPLRKRAAERIARGHVEVTLGYEAGTAPAPLVGSNLPLAREYARGAKALGEAAGVKGQLKLSALLALPEVLYLVPLEADPEAALTAAMGAFDAACDAADAVRAAEGEQLKGYFTTLLDGMETALRDLREAADAQPGAARERLEKRLAGMPDIQVDPQRLAQEIALFADRADIAEEISRLSAHCVRMRELLASQTPKGRDMDFLVQEMNREGNTICSKSASLRVTELGLLLKGFADKIREQAQNVE